MAEERFWVSTGDIRESYEVLNIVSTMLFNLVERDFEQACRQAVDNMARSAMQLGANGVIWIRVNPVEKPLGFGVYATGTAVRVNSAAS